MGPPHLFEALPDGPPPQGRLATLQSLSGTGSLRLGAEFLAKFLPGTKVFLSNPTWCACLHAICCQLMRLLYDHIASNISVGHGKMMNDWSES